jgi:hypothetical protein
VIKTECIPGLIKGKSLKEKGKWENRSQRIQVTGRLNQQPLSFSFVLFFFGLITLPTTSTLTTRVAYCPHRAWEKEELGLEHPPCAFGNHMCIKIVNSDYKKTNEM